MASWVIVEMAEHADYGEEGVTTYDVPFRAIGPFDTEQAALLYDSSHTTYLTEIVEMDAP